MKEQIKIVNDYRNEKKRFTVRMTERGRKGYWDEFHKIDNELDKIEDLLLDGISLDRQMEILNKRYDDITRPFNKSKWNVLVDLLK